MLSARQQPARRLSCRQHESPEPGILRIARRALMARRFLRAAA